jgi:hypothetical protein
VAGEDCFILKTRVYSAEALEALINRIRSRITVQRSVTMIALSAVKEEGVLTASREAKAPFGGRQTKDRVSGPRTTDDRRQRVAAGARGRSGMRGG